MLLGVLFTVLFSGIFLESYKRHRDLQGVASAIVGEISSIIHMTEKRGTTRHFSWLLGQLEAGSPVNFPDITGGDPGQDDPIARCHLDKIGLVPGNLPERIVIFYTYLRGIRIDIMNLSKGVFKDPKEQAAIIRADLILWADAAQLGNSIFADLRNISLQPWWVLAICIKLRNSAIRKLQFFISGSQNWNQKLKGVANFSRGGSANTSPEVEKPPQPSTQSANLAEALPTSQQAVELFNPPFQDIVTEVARNLDTVMLPALMSRFNGDKERALRYALIDFQSAVALERASRFLFGSQIDALIFLGTSGGRGTKEELTNFYRAAAVKYPEIYAKYTFEAWLGFMQNQGLVSINGDTVAFLPAGKAIIAYMQTRGYLATRAPG